MCLLKFISERLHYHEKIVVMNGIRLKALVADTPMKRMIGLMYRKTLGRDRCMLFVFGSEGRYGIWMRNMRFGIDVIWLDKQKRIVHVERALAPARGFDFRTYYPDTASSYVIELASGFTDRNDIRKGMRVVFS